MLRELEQRGAFLEKLLGLTAGGFVAYLLLLKPESLSSMLASFLTISLLAAAAVFFTQPLTDTKS